jgi:hypothetical protein
MNHITGVLNLKNSNGQFAKEDLSRSVKYKYYILCLISYLIFFLLLLPSVHYFSSFSLSTVF